MAKDKSVIFITFDLGYSFFENIQKRFPDRFINAGCIEDAGVGIAAGLARSGKKPYVYSTAPFLIFRALEQIRNDVAYPNLNVKLIGVSHSGFLGFSHQLLGRENIYSILENFPNLEIYDPKIPEELDAVMKDTYKRKVPTYIKV